MAKAQDEIKIAEAPVSDWIERLGDVLQTIDKMGPDERTAAFKYIKSRYAKDWPADSY